jgi:hypothetical protein
LLNIIDLATRNKNIVGKTIQRQNRDKKIQKLGLRKDLEFKQKRRRDYILDLLKMRRGYHWFMYLSLRKDLESKQ